MKHKQLFQPARWSIRSPRMFPDENTRNSYPPHQRCRWKTLVNPWFIGSEGRPNKKQGGMPEWEPVEANTTGLRNQKKSGAREDAAHSDLAEIKDNGRQSHDRIP